MGAELRTIADFKVWFAKNARRFSLRDQAIRSKDLCRCPLEVWFAVGKGDWILVTNQVVGAHYIVCAADRAEATIGRNIEEELRAFMLAEMSNVH